MPPTPPPPPPPPTPRLVVDASAVLAWIFGEDTSTELNRIFEQLDEVDVVVPALWRLEVVNAILVRERRGLMTESHARLILQHLASLGFEVSDDHRRSLDEMALFARPHGLTAYDAAYLELAIRHDLPLCTLDTHMAAVATTLGVPLVLHPPTRTR